MSATTRDSAARASTRHFIFTEEHELLRESIAAFVARELAPHVLAWEETTFPDEVFTRMGELGFLGLTVPERYGGQGGDYPCALVLAEEMTAVEALGVTMGVALQTDMATPPILEFGTEEQKQRYLAPAVRGERIAALGITEPGGGSDVAAIRTRATPDGPDWVIRGSKAYITNGARADFLVLLARTGDGPRDFAMFLVDADLPGYVVEKRLEKLGMHGSDTALLAFDDVRVPGDAVLGEVGRGFQQAMWELQHERVISAAGCVAAADRVLARTLVYMREREAFGRPISELQALRHRVAELAARIHATRELVYGTAWRHAAGEYPVAQIAMAKLHAARLASDVADECLQLHGGAGYMREYGIERAWRDLRVHRIGAGTDEVMLELIARSLDV